MKSVERTGTATKGAELNLKVVGIGRWLPAASRRWLNAAVVVVAVWSIGCASSSQRQARGVPAAKAGVSARMAAQLPTAPDAPVYAFTCIDGFQFVARVGVEVAWVYRPGGAVALARGGAAGGLKYGDGPVILWMKGSSALLEEIGAIHRGCENDPRRAADEKAKLVGAEFPAPGTAP